MLDQKKKMNQFCMYDQTLVGCNQKQISGLPLSCIYTQNMHKSHICTQNMYKNHEMPCKNRECTQLVLKAVFKVGNFYLGVRPTAQPACSEWLVPFKSVAQASLLVFRKKDLYAKTHIFG